MIGLFFLIILGLVLLYEIFIFKVYKKVVTKYGEKVLFKLILLFLIFLPFYDVIIGYSKIGLNILQEPTIQVTDAGKKFKEDYLFFKRFLYQDDFTIEKAELDEFIYKVIKLDDKYYALFALDEINKKIKDKEYLENKKILVDITKELSIKYKPINFVYISYNIDNNKYYNYFTDELLLINNFNFNIENNDTKYLKYYIFEPYNKYLASYNNFTYPVHMLHDQTKYKLNTRIYSMNDYLIDSEYFNVKYFLFFYILICFMVFIYLLFRVKALYLLLYIGFIFVVPNLISCAFYYKDIYFNKNELTLEELGVTPEEIIKRSCYKISFDNLIKKKEIDKNFYQFYIYNNYKFTVLNYYNNDGALKNKVVLLYIANYIQLMICLVIIIYIIKIKMKEVKNVR